MGYAAGTSVSVDRTQAEIKKILAKYKAGGFAFGEQGKQALVMFEMGGRRFKFVLPMVEYGKSRDKRNHLLSQDGVGQENRRRWRCLALAIKAKLECVESGITTLEQEFMAHIVLPGGKTVGEVMVPQIAASYGTGQMPPLLGFDGDHK